MTFAEFLTYCELKNIISVDIHNSTGRVLSIDTPRYGFALYLNYNIVGGTPMIVSGQFYRYSDRELDFAKSFKITMDEIEEVFFPNEIS